MICVEYVILTFGVLFLQKRKLNKFFENLRKFDKILNIENNIDITVPTKAMYYWIGIGIIYITIDLKRSGNQTTKKLEELSGNVELDTHSLHRVFELLFSCCEQFNSLMGLPLLLLLFTSGLATTMLIKFIINLAQSDISHTTQVKTMIANACSRCIKYTFLIIIPCYLSSVTAREVKEIRGMLYEAMHFMDFGKIERRKVKAFYQLTCDSEFAYVVSGIIKLDMSLPLSYCSLCTTYLVIVIQFSKFFD
ncbi:uncharacterized protein [Epargyreus clarus]|uniref:uncharacterized protein n=1 Tax=Epargyreus clarus TaxID=520877 RepID=UPI003C2CD2C0